MLFGVNKEILAQEIY